MSYDALSPWQGLQHQLWKLRQTGHNLTQPEEDSCICYISHIYVILMRTLKVLREPQHDSSAPTAITPSTSQPACPSTYATSTSMEANVNFARHILHYIFWDSHRCLLVRQMKHSRDVWPPNASGCERERAKRVKLERLHWSMTFSHTRQHRVYTGCPAWKVPSRTEAFFCTLCM